MRATTVVAVLSQTPAEVAAHPVPAAPPVFDAGPCVRVVDREAEPIVHFGYGVPMDDVQLTTGDIVLPDAMTHQFFAFRGAILFEGFEPRVWSFDPSDPSATTLPLWISRRDVERSQESSDRDGLGYDLSTLTDEVVLETTSALEGRWARITSDDRRVPITTDQSFLGFDWHVADVEPGIYTVAGYIFSPPYNGWEIRPGVVKIRTAHADPPAGVLSRVQASVFPGQGRRVRVCLDVPEGTRMRTYARFEDGAASEWEEWGEAQDVTSGELELCYLAASTARTGALRLRVDLIAGDMIRSVYSPDRLVLLAGQSRCLPSESICCPMDPGGDAGPASVADGGGDAAAVDGLVSPRDGAETGPEDGRARRDGGCSVRPRAAPPRGFVWGVLVGLGVGVAHLRAKRRRGLRRDVR